MNTGWDPLGVTPDGHGGANVALWAQSALAVDLCVFPDDDAEYRIPLNNKVFNIFHTHVSDLPVGSRYGFRVEGPWQPLIGQRWNPNKLLLDPYARAIDGKFDLNTSVFGHTGDNDLTMSTLDSAPFVPRSVVTDTWFDWGGDTHPNTAWGDTLIYEAHVRGLTSATAMCPSTNAARMPGWPTRPSSITC